MSGLRSALEEYGLADVAAQSDAQVEDDLVELQRVSELLEIEKARRVAQVARRGWYERDGHLSVTSWLTGRFRLSGGAARDQVRIARGLEEMPLVREALRDGEISLPAVRVLAHAREAAPAAFGDAESLLVDVARTHPVGHLHRVVTHWRERAVADGFDVRAGRRLHASVTLGGMVRVDGDLDPEGGEVLLTALAAVMDAGSRSREQETRTPAQRRADALEEICRSYLGRADRPTVAGERPHVVVTVPLEGLIAGDGGDLDRVGSVPGRDVRRLACDATVTRIVLGPRSEPLDVGRRTAVVSGALRRALIARDRACRFPGCDRHHGWCDAHHVRHWADGGATGLHNLVLLCRRHHRAIHEGGFGLGMEGTHPVFRRPDGSILEDRAPP